MVPKFNIGFNIGLNLGFNIEFNIGFNIGFYIAFNIGFHIGSNIGWVNIQHTLNHLHSVDLGYMQKFSFLGHQEVVKKDGLGVGGWVVSE